MKLFYIFSITVIAGANSVNGCAPPGFVPSQDPRNYVRSSPIQRFDKHTTENAFVNARCSDLVLYPISSVDQNDQYRFDYSDVSFGNTHSQGATVAITCTSNGQPATVEGYDQASDIFALKLNHARQRTSISSAPSLLATCTNVGGSQYTWTILGRILQFVDCRF